MCGICGYISKDELNTSILSRMTDSITHRGPDDVGEYYNILSDGSQIALGQRRLSILDLSAAGHQPFQSDNGRYIIVYNGEVYNFKELRKDLIEKGYGFRSNCDTEVILYAYIEYGVDSFNMLNGMFAFAIWDREKEILLFARDRMGKKPLYYYVDGNNLVFGSELKALMIYPGFKKVIRTELISSFLCNKSIASPDTIFENTYKVEPGQYIIWQSCGPRDSLIKDYYWKLLDVYERNSQSLELDYTDAKKNIKTKLLDAVSKRLVADVPVGCFLSGGIDSTLISALAREVSDKKIQTYSIGFHDADRDEAPYAKEIAKFLETSHTEKYINENDLLNQIDDLSYFYDEPFSDASLIPSRVVCQMAREHITVALSGDGGDELFCGYEMYDWMPLIQRYDFIGKLCYDVSNAPLVRSMHLLDYLPDKAYSLAINRNPDTKLQCFIDVRQRYTRDIVLGDSISAKYIDFEHEIHQLASAKNNLQLQRMLLDMRYYMPDEVLVKMDRASMANSLEVRCPILDYNIVEYSFHLPHNFKYKNKEKKYILKDILYDMVPRELVDRPKKGFGVPLSRWIRSELNSEIHRYADPKLLDRQGIFNAKYLNNLINKLENKSKSDCDYIIWSFLIFQKWYDCWIENM